MLLVENGYDRELHECTPLSDDQLRRGRLMLVAPQMYAALKLVLGVAEMPAPLTLAIDRLVRSIDGV